MLETLANELNRLKKLQNGRKKKPQGYYFVCLSCIKRQSFIGWSVLDIEKHELGVDYTGAIKLLVFRQRLFLKTRCPSYRGN